MNIAATYIAICLAASGGVLILGAPELSLLVVASALSIATLGVPHGGLDHWAGRRLLAAKFAERWWIIFFLSYLSIAMAFAAAWYIVPTMAVPLFFIASAWHFGREDDQTRKDQPTQRVNNERRIDHIFLVHINAAAVGGLAIWISALLRPDEMHQLLSIIVPSTNVDAAQQIVVTTQWLSFILVPWAGIVTGLRGRYNAHDLNSWVPLATTLLAMCTPILLSFSIYFCGWHSIQGLLRLQRQEHLSRAKFVMAVLPLSVAAIVGIGLVGWYWRDVDQILTSGTTPMALQTLFIGLSAIAVPHLMLHEFEKYQNTAQLFHEVVS